jgi:hypothetical protein
MDAKEDLIKIPYLVSTEETYPDKTTVVIGKRASGKTVLIIKEIYRQLQHKIKKENIYVFTSGSDYYTITDHKYRFSELDSILAVMDHSQHSLFIFEDDCISISSFIDNDKMKDLSMNGRDHNISIVVVQQYTTLAPEFRRNVDIVHMSSNHQVGYIKRIYDHYFPTKLDIDQFVQTVKTLPRFSFLVLICIGKRSVGWIKTERPL